MTKHYIDGEELQKKILGKTQSLKIRAGLALPEVDLNKERKKSTIILNRVLSRVRLTDAMILRLRYSGANIARSRISARIAYTLRELELIF